MAVKTYAPAPASATIERSPRGQLQRLQKDRFIALFRRTWEHIPFYRKLWQEKGIGPNDIRLLADLEKLPVISKRDLEADLLAYPPFGSYQGNFPAIRVQASSGSTGNPKAFFPPPPRLGHDNQSLVAPPLCPKSSWRRHFSRCLYLFIVYCRLHRHRGGDEAWSVGGAHRQWRCHTERAAGPTSF